MTIPSTADEPRRARWIPLPVGVTVAIASGWIFLPALSGYHIGDNVLTDNVCLSRVFQWCKHAQPAAAPTVSTAVDPSQVAPPAAPAATTTTSSSTTAAPAKPAATWCDANGHPDDAHGHYLCAMGPVSQEQTNSEQPEQP